MIALAYITLNTLRTEAPGLARPRRRATPLPPFAAPLALSRPRRRRQPRHRARPGRAGHAAGLRGPRPGRPQLLPAGRARPGRARVPRRRARRRCDRAGRRARAVRSALPRRRRSPPWRSAATATTCARHDPQPRLDAAGRLRPRRRRRQRLRGGDLPDDRRSPTRAAACRATSLTLLEGAALRRRDARGAPVSDEPAAPRGRGRGGAGRGVAGAAAGLRRVRAVPGAEPARAARAAARCCRTASAAPQAIALRRQPIPHAYRVVLPPHRARARRASGSRSRRWRWSG